jgi:hypothetical protein
MIKIVNGYASWIARGVAQVHAFAPEPREPAEVGFRVERERPQVADFVEKGRLKP